MSRPRKGVVTRTGGREATKGVIPGRYGLSVGHPGTPAPEGWAWTSLSSVARLETGHTPSRKHPEYWGGDIPWLGIKDVTPNYGRTLAKTQEYATQLGIDNSSARVLPAGTVCLSRTASVGYVIVMGVPMATSQDFVNWVCSPRLDAYYLKYVLMADRASYLRFASGTTHQTIYLPEVKAFHVLLPPIEVQQRIAAVLAAYDELIENNLRRIEILEEMAQVVYREWFVNFRFPGHEHAALIDSPIGPIPDGWTLVKFGVIANEVKDGVDPKAVDPDDRYVGLEHIPQGSFTLTDSGCAADVTSRKWRFRTGDILFGKLRPYFHKVVEAGFEGICSTDAIVIRPERGFQDVALQVAFSGEFVAHAVATSGGTDRPRAKWSDLANFDVLIPDAASGESFSRAVRPMVNLAANLGRQNDNLRAARDLLLPRLVSGEIDVSDLDIDTEWLAS